MIENSPEINASSSSNEQKNPKTVAELNSELINALNPDKSGNDKDPRSLISILGDLIKASEDESKKPQQGELNDEDDPEKIIIDWINNRDIENNNLKKYCFSSSGKLNEYIIEDYNDLKKNIVEMVNRIPENISISDFSKMINRKTKNNFKNYFLLFINVYLLTVFCSADTYLAILGSTETVLA